MRPRNGNGYPRNKGMGGAPGNEGIKPINSQIKSLIVRFPQELTPQLTDEQLTITDLPDVHDSEVLTEPI